MHTALGVYRARVRSRGLSGSPASPPLPVRAPELGLPPPACAPGMGRVRTPWAWAPGADAHVGEHGELVHFAQHLKRGEQLWIHHRLVKGDGHCVPPRAILPSHHERVHPDPPVLPWGALSALRVVFRRAPQAAALTLAAKADA